MNPLYVLTALFASAFAKPTATVVAAPHALAGVHGIHAPLLHGAHAPLLHAGAAAPLLHAAPHVVQPAAISLPAPHVTHEKDPDVTTIHKPEPIITKQVHLGQTSYVSGYTTQILKPAIPDFKIAVPTALKGTHSVNPAIVTVQKEVHTVNEPVHVEVPYDVPYDVIKHVEKVVEVPVAHHVAKPVPVPHPYPVAGEPIVHKTVGAPIVRHHHHQHVAAPAVHAFAHPVAHAAHPVAHAVHPVAAAHVAISGH